MLNKNEIETYIKEVKSIGLGIELTEKSNSLNHKKSKSKLIKLKTLVFIIRSFLDFLLLKFVLLFPKYKNKRFVYTSYRFTTISDGVVEDRVVKPLFTDNILFINQSKEIWISKINNQKVYNIGGVARLIAMLSKGSNTLLKDFYAYQKVNSWFLKKFSSKEIYFLVHYDIGNLSIIFSDFRHTLKLIEIQHGGIVNYAPYMQKAPIKMIDLFYVKNKTTIKFLEEHMCKDYDCEYKLLPYPKIRGEHRQGIHILYASTVEFDGVHPIFLNYLKTTGLKDINVYIRLHPREKHKKEHFENQLLGVKASICFDESKNWLESNQIKNLIVVSPWSSVIEDAADNGFKTIILEEFGKNRFGYLIDQENVIFAPDNHLFIKNISLLIEQNEL